MVHIYKPEFVKHDGGSPIFSVDCHPDGTRMATAGGDQKVKLWNLKALKNREVEADPNVPRVLATLSDHFNTVNCVRFSKNGRFLASGSTDSNVFLYEKRPGPGRARQHPRRCRAGPPGGWTSPAAGSWRALFSGVVADGGARRRSGRVCCV